MEQRTYRTLKSLNEYDYRIVDGEPNIIGWEVKDEAGMYIGEVKDLLFDPGTNSVRYLIVDLEGNGMNLGDKKVMIPIGVAHLDSSDDEVVLPNMHIEHLDRLPAYNENARVPATEVEIRHIMESQTGMHKEEAIDEFDQEKFYAHQHFDRDRFYQRGGHGERTTAQHTIHQMVEHSKSHGYHAAAPETGRDTHHNEGRTGNIPNDDPGSL